MKEKTKPIRVRESVHRRVKIHAAKRNLTISNWAEAKLLRGIAEENSINK